MNYREREILSIIFNQRPIGKITDLASSFGVSTRTIRNDINNINYFLKKNSVGSLVIEEKGVIKNRVSKNAVQIKSIQENQNLYDDRLSKDERVSLLAIILAVSSKKYITIEQMAEMVYSSKATIVKDIKQVKEKLNENEIQIFSFPNKGFMIDGKESDIRKFVWNEPKSVVVMHFLEELFQNFKTIRTKRKSLIKKIVEEQEHVHAFYLTDSSYDKLVFYIQIMIWRIAEGCYVEEFALEDSEFSNIAADISKYVSQYCSIVATEYESLFLGEILRELQYLKKTEQNQEIVHIQIVTRRFIEQVSRDLHEDLEVDYDLFENLCNHLASAFQTEKVSFPQDSIFYEIAKRNSFVFQVMSDNQYILEDYAKRKLLEIETIYITIHICAALERKKKQGNSFRVVLVCQGGIGTSQLLAAKLKNNFTFQIIDILSAHELQYINKNYADLIISTIPLDSPPIEYVQTSFFLDENDCSIIKDKIEQLRKVHATVELKSGNGEKAFINKLKSIIYSYDFPDKRKAAKRIENTAMEFLHKDHTAQKQVDLPYLHQFLTEDFIQLDISCDNWQDAVKKSGKRLLDMGYISESYIEAMIHNIKVNGPYIIISPEFAMPHADLDAGSYKTGMNLIRLTESVNFGKDQSAITKFVCCLCAVDYKTHIKALINLINILANEKFRKELKAASTPKQAARIIREYEYALEEKEMD